MVERLLPRVRHFVRGRHALMEAQALGEALCGALVLIVEPGRRHRVDPQLVAKTLDLTPAETQVAVWLAEGRSVRDMAEATGHTEGTIYWHLKQIYQKQSISRQADLVQLVLSLAELG